MVEWMILKRETVVAAAAAAAAVLVAVLGFGWRGGGCILCVFAL